MDEQRTRFLFFFFLQLKLFIETSVLQKCEKPRYKAVATEACEENTQEKNQGKRGSPGAKY